jgi:hypothetical protein
MALIPAIQDVYGRCGDVNPLPLPAIRQNPHVTS